MDYLICRMLLLCENKVFDEIKEDKYKNVTFVAFSEDEKQINLKKINFGSDNEF